MSNSTTNIIPGQAKRSNSQVVQGLKMIVDYYKNDVNLILQHLYKKGYTYKDIGEIMGVTRQAVENRFPKEGIK